ncbi:hypothetical protein A3715_10265 [Oleiphilus sp. HI0009]|nr:hypothetical protein A3715_10265 [Oleiphilus sp. HI0009]
MEQLKTFKLGNTSVDVSCEWDSNQGEKWTFDISISDQNDDVWPVQFVNPNIQLSLVDTAIRKINTNKEIELSNRPLIKKVQHSEKEAIVEWLNSMNVKNQPKYSAEDSYYGV